MKMVRAIYEGGTFHPLDRIDLPEGAMVTFDINVVSAEIAELEAMDAIYGIMSRRFKTGVPNLAENHDAPLP